MADARVVVEDENDEDGLALRVDDGGQQTSAGNVSGLPEELLLLPASDPVDVDAARVAVEDGDDCDGGEALLVCTCSCDKLPGMAIYSVGFLLEQTEYSQFASEYEDNDDHFENYRSRPRFQSPEDPHELLNPLTLASSTMTALPAESTPPSSIAPKRKLIIPDVEAAPINFLLENHDTSGDIEEENELDLKEYSAEGAGGDGVPTDISERSKKSPYPDVVSLTLDEIALIRGALAKAELENLEEQDARLFDDIRRSKVCFSCRRVRFSQFVWMFREGGVKCHLCQNTICASCSRQMVLPCDRLDRIPVHTLSPALDDDDLALPEPAHRQPVLQQRPISSASTMPRQRSQLQRSHTLEFVSSTLPKPQTRSRPALQRGLTMSSAPNSSRHQHSPWPPAPAMRRKISLPSEEPPSSFTMQVCVECHSVLYHAIMESQTPPLSASRAASSIRKPGISYHTSASSVISDSRSDSLEDDEDFCDLSDFVDEVGQTTGHAHQQRNGMHLGVVLGSGGPHRGDESVSPANSRSDSTSSEAGSFYTEPAVSVVSFWNVTAPARGYVTLTMTCHCPVLRHFNVSSIPWDNDEVAHLAWTLSASSPIAM
ncbi:hypothetical protein BV898_14750 [Hypsibius exemplaris]|uniref:Uncharacterized protein n=1 Tax=Hypsibius exemplaris TaxID=2072580 RepID=A0A9X6RJV8_HYPEX|nr:hypothetical protein BV898_14750 [Hypsibius exemplaris]